MLASITLRNFSPGFHRAAYPKAHNLSISVKQYFGSHVRNLHVPATGNAVYPFKNFLHFQNLKSSVPYLSKNLGTRPLRIGKSNCPLRLYSTSGIPEAASSASVSSIGTISEIEFPLSASVAGMTPAPGLTPWDGFNRLFDVMHYSNFTDPFQFAIEGCLEMLQSITGLPWWLTVVLLSAIFRLLLSHYTFMQSKSTTHLELLRPQLAQLEQKLAIDNATLSTTQLRRLTTIETKKLMEKHGTGPFRTFKYTIPQSFVYISIFVAIRRIGDGNSILHGAFSTGGSLWFTNLLVADPYYILPAIVGITTMASVCYGPTAPKDQMSMVKWGAVAGVFLGLASCLFAPGLHLVWISSNIVGLFVNWMSRSSFIHRLYSFPTKIDVKEKPKLFDSPPQHQRIARKPSTFNGNKEYSKYK